MRKPEWITNWRTIFIAKHLYKKIVGPAIAPALRLSCCSTDRAIVDQANEQGWMNGSTAVVGVVADRKLYIGNIGDSEAILIEMKYDALLLSLSLSFVEFILFFSITKRWEGKPDQLDHSTQGV